MMMFLWCSEIDVCLPIARVESVVHDFPTRYISEHLFYVVVASIVRFY